MCWSPGHCFLKAIDDIGIVIGDTIPDVSDML
jgi:hypothetical protein